ncbi:MAG: iron-sulfur cluster assembly protein, partial [Myxococcales bacterium]
MTSEQVLAALKEVKDPSSGRTLADLGMLKAAEVL